MTIKVTIEDTGMPPRAGHSIYKFEEIFFLFFGYDVFLDAPTNCTSRRINKKWKEIETKGDIPKERYGQTMCERSKGILIFYGGKR